MCLVQVALLVVHLGWVQFAAPVAVCVPLPPPPAATSPGRPLFYDPYKIKRT